MPLMMGIKRIELVADFSSSGKVERFEKRIGE